MTIICPICGEELNNIPKDIKEQHEEHGTIIFWYEEDLVCENCGANLDLSSKNKETFTMTSQKKRKKTIGKTDSPKNCSFLSIKQIDLE